MSGDSDIHLKIFFADKTVKRLPLPASLTLAQLVADLRRIADDSLATSSSSSAFSVESTSAAALEGAEAAVPVRFRLEYEDDESDRVRCSTESEWTEAKRIGVKLLKLYVLADMRGPHSAVPAVSPVVPSPVPVPVAQVPQPQPQPEPPVLVPVEVLDSSAAAAAAVVVPPPDSVPSSLVLLDDHIRQPPSLSVGDSWVMVDHPAEHSPVPPPPPYVEPLPVLLPPPQPQPQHQDLPEVVPVNEVVPVAELQPEPFLAAQVDDAALAAIVAELEAAEAARAAEASAEAARRAEVVPPPPLVSNPSDPLAWAVGREAARDEHAPAPAPAPAPVPQIPEEQPIPVPVPAPAPVQHHVPVLPMVKFMADVSIEPGTSVEQGVWFTKTWRLGNPPQAPSDWPPGCYLKLVGGSVLEGARDVHVVCPVALRPRETADFSVRVRAPFELGEHSSYFKLHTPTGNQFGDVYAIRISVVPRRAGVDEQVVAQQQQQQPVAVAAPMPAPIVPEQPPYPYQYAPQPQQPQPVPQPQPQYHAPSPVVQQQQQPVPPQQQPAEESFSPEFALGLDALVEMGFARPLALYHLRQANGDVEAAMELLLELQSRVAASQ